MTPTALRAAALALVPLLAPAPQDAPAPAADPAAADTKLLNDLMAQARPFVEKQRGKKFDKLPTAAPTTREAFLEKHHRDLERILGGKERVDASSRLLGRLGIIPEGADLRALLRDFLPQNVAAQYDPQGKRITFLPGVARSLSTMVHEMAHALDDAHFDMEAQVALFGGEFDRALAYGSLCEGNAMSVEYRVALGDMFIGQPLEQIRTQGNMMADMLLASSGKTPPALALAFKAQYIEGLVFAEALRRKGGEEAIDAAFRRPPRTTEQVLHPEKYEADEAPVVLRLAPPGPGGKVLVETPLGELGCFLVLAARKMKPDEARAAAAGWAGDRIALVSCGEAGEALVWTTTWDTEADASEFEKALKSAFPVTSGGTGPVRGIVARGATVEFVEAGLDALEDAVRMAREAKRELPPAKPAAAPEPPK